MILRVRHRQSYLMIICNNNRDNYKRKWIPVWKNKKEPPAASIQKIQKLSSIQDCLLWSSWMSLALPIYPWIIFPKIYMISVCKLLIKCGNSILSRNTRLFCMRNNSKFADILNLTSKLQLIYHIQLKVHTCTQATTPKTTMMTYLKNSSLFTRQFIKKISDLTRWSRTGIKMSKIILLLIRIVREVWFKMVLFVWCLCMRMITLICSDIWKLCPRRVLILWVADSLFGLIMDRWSQCMARLKISSSMRSRNQINLWQQGLVYHLGKWFEWIF